MSSPYDPDKLSALNDIAFQLEAANKLKLVELKLYARNHGQRKELDDYLAEADYLGDFNDDE